MDAAGTRALGVVNEPAGRCGTAGGYRLPRGFVCVRGAGLGECEATFRGAEYQSPQARVLCWPQARTARLADLEPFLSTPGA